MSEHRVFFIGAGVVGTTLGYFLARSRNYQVVGFCSRSFSSAQRAVSRVGSGRAVGQIEDLLPEADVVLITTPDDAIAEVGQKVAASQKLAENAVLMHTSGAHPSSILRRPAEVNYSTVSLHPLQTFSDFASARRMLPGSLAVIEGDDRGRREAVCMARSLDMPYEVIRPEGKPLYHAAACVASNYLVVLLDLALALDEAAGLSREQALAALKPLILATLQNVEEHGTVGAITGPIARGDIETVRSHLKAMPHAGEKAEKTYRSLGRAAVQLARQKRSISCTEAESLRQILSIGGDENE